jgi:Domain of unknown function (DUF4349)
MRSPICLTLVLSWILLACNRPLDSVVRGSGHAGEPSAATTTMPAQHRNAADASAKALAPDSPALGLTEIFPVPTALGAMIIRTGQASLQVDSLEIAVARVTALATRLGGYIAGTDLRAGKDQFRMAALEVKVPSPRFSDLTGDLGTVGKVEQVNVQAQDVGEEFTDIASRVTNAQRLEQRLLDLLATRTGKLADVLELERELARVREESERMEGRMRYLRAHAAMSSLTVTVHEAAPLVIQAGSAGIIGEAVRQAWRNFVQLIAHGIESMGVALPLGALAFAALLALRRLRRTRQVPVR